MSQGERASAGTSGRGHGEKLSRLQTQAVNALLAAKTIGEAAAAVGTHEKTLRRWLKLPAFRAQFDAARATLMDEGLTALQRACGGAVDVLVTIASNAEASDASRVSACRVILEMTLRHVDQIQIQQRIERLESAAGRTTP
jgi:hypothetical protein